MLSSQTPVQRVFDTVELLEHVLARIAPIDVALGRRVCRHWQAVILDSEKLQKLLYIRPDIHKLSIVWEKKPAGTYDPYGDAENQYRPLVGKKLTSSDDGPGKATEIAVPVRKLIGYTEGSWRQMFITQPPITTTTVHFCVSNEDGQFQHDLVIQAPSGIIIRHLLQGIVTGLHRFNQRCSNEEQHHDGDGCEADESDLKEHETELKDIIKMRWTDVDDMLRDEGFVLDVWVVMRGVIPANSPYVATAYESAQGYQNTE
ncbi:hypothetical protein LTR85_012063 [Meristemomyces frigidus]|nr:hypothetical protein LTR85_012063 [Meristemomyces frigidus]